MMTEHTYLLAFKLEFMEIMTSIDSNDLSLFPLFCYLHWKFQHFKNKNIFAYTQQNFKKWFKNLIIG